MGKHRKKQVSHFELEGCCVGFVIKDSSRIKAMKLSTPSGDRTIKLSKDLRAALHTTDLLGARVQVIGSQTVNPKKGTEKFKAKRIIAGGRVLPDDAEPDVSSPEAEPPVKADEQKPKPATILVCKKSDCCKRGGKEVSETLETLLSDRNLDDQVKVKYTGCMKHCKAGPNLVMPDKTRYSRITPDDVSELIESHFQ